MESTPIKICTVRRTTKPIAIQNERIKPADNEDTKNTDISNSDISVLKGYEKKQNINQPDSEKDLNELMLPLANMWDAGREIKIAFIGGTKRIHDHIKEVANEWLTYANLNFLYTSKADQAEVRIRFNKRSGSWSTLGNETLQVEGVEPTMNFGWLDTETTEEDFRSVVLHEFKHMIGCGHEHESPKDGGVPWNKEKTYKYYMRTQAWSKEEVDAQIFSTYKNNQIRGTRLDKKSIMMYAIPESITHGNFRVGWNTELSQSDKIFIKKAYPFS